VVLEGLAGAAVTVLDADRTAGPVVEVSAASDVTVRGLTLTGVVAGVGGGAVILDDGVAATIEDCLLEGNEADLGAGVHVGQGGQLVLRRTTVSANTAAAAATGLGGGVYAERDAVVTLEQGHVDGDDASHGGGGVYLEAGAELVGSDGSTVSGNTCGLAGAGISANGRGSSIRGTEAGGLTIAGNSTSNAAGGVVGQDFTMSWVVVRANHAGLGGAGLVAHGVVDLEHVTVVGNDAGQDGPGIYAGGDTDQLTLTDCTIGQNVGHFGTRGTVATGFHPWGEVYVGGQLASNGTDWSGLDADQTPDVGLPDSHLVYEFEGVQTFACDDGSGQGCH
jgi:hypothetical protein